jgi:hypothetical protein
MFMEENQQQEQEQVKVEPTVIVPVVTAAPKKSFTKRISPLLYIIGTLLFIYFVLPSIQTTVKDMFKDKDAYKENQVILNAIDSLKKEADSLRQKQLILDSINQEYNVKINTVDSQIANTKTTTTIIKEIHHDRIKQAPVRNTNQIDSFLRSRYQH